MAMSTPDARDVAIGIDVGGTKLLGLLVTRDGEVLADSHHATPHDVERGLGVATAEAMADQIEQLTAAVGLRPSDVAVGLGVPGLVRRSGELAFAPNLLEDSGANYPAHLYDQMGISQVYVDNDGNCAALAEYYWGAARGVDDFCMVTLGTGIGGGVIANGQLVRGHSGFAGEIGHMVVAAGGWSCGCGGRGCWETYASGTGLGRLAQAAVAEGRLPSLAARHAEQPLRGEDVTHAAAQGNEEALAIMRESAWWLAQGLANLAAILDSSHFVIGGGLSRAANILLPMATEYVSELTMGHSSRPPISLVPAQLDVRAGALGAASVAFSRRP